MPTALPTDQELDPTELADQEDPAEDGEEAAVEPEEEGAVAPDPDAEIVAEINKVAADVEEDEEEDGAAAPAAKKAGMISEELIQRPLSAEDLFDDGYL